MQLYYIVTCYIYKIFLKNDQNYVTHLENFPSTYLCKCYKFWGIAFTYLAVLLQNLNIFYNGLHREKMASRYLEVKNWLIRPSGREFFDFFFKIFMWIFALLFTVKTYLFVWVHEMTKLPEFKTNVTYFMISTVSPDNIF